MPKESFEFHLPFRKMLIGLLITVVPINLVVLYSITESSNSIEQSVGGHLRETSQSLARETAAFIHDSVLAASLMAADSAVLDAVKEANSAYAGFSDEAVAARIESIEAVWNKPSGEAAVRRVSSNRASDSLRRKLALAQNFLRITVTDQNGATVAASNKTIDYNQADEDYWQKIYAEGRGAISLTDVLYDEATLSNYIGIGVPVVDHDGSFLGTFDALVDVSTLTPILTQPHLGDSGRALLVKRDGAIIASSVEGVTLSSGMMSQEMAAVTDALSTLQGRQIGYIEAGMPGEGDTLIGFADTGLLDDYSELQWVVVVAQRSAEAFAPVLRTQRLTMGIAFTAMACVVLFAVYVSLHRKSEIDEIEEEMSRIGDSVKSEQG